MRKLFIVFVIFIISFSVSFGATKGIEEGIRETFAEIYSGAPSTLDKYAGTYKITHYCSACNTPPGSTQTSTGRYVVGYSVASSDFAPGTILIINGEEYRVDDCGCAPGIVDKLVDDSNGCKCNNYGVYYAEVYIRR